MPVTDMPLLGFGTCALAGEEAIDCTLMALELSFRHLDMVQMYGNEAEVGRALLESGLHRDEVFLTTDVLPDSYDENRFTLSVRQSLEKLKSEQVDLLLLHWPHPSLPMEAVLERLVAMKEAGLAKAIGVSNFGPDDLDRAQTITVGLLACNQIEIYPFVDQRPSIKACAALGLRITAYCPVARGKVIADPTLRAIGQAHGKSPAQIAIAWLVHQSIAAIPMSRSRMHAQANLESAKISLSNREMRQIDAIASPNGKLIDPTGQHAQWGAPSGMTTSLCFGCLR